MIINGTELLKRAPIINMLDSKVQEHGVSHGLAEVGYDITIKQRIHFKKQGSTRIINVGQSNHSYSSYIGRFVLASAIEEFDMPTNMMAVVHDKSTWARQGLAVFNTIIEPNWKGFLTLELVYHGDDELIIPAGAGIAQVVFHEICEYAAYTGKYQNQADKPVGAINE